MPVSSLRKQRTAFRWIAKAFKVLLDFFQKIAGPGQRPGRPPQRAKYSYMHTKSQEGMETLLSGVHMGGTGSMPVPPIFSRRLFVLCNFSCKPLFRQSEADHPPDGWPVCFVSGRVPEACEADGGQRKSRSVTYKMTTNR